MTSNYVSTIQDALTNKAVPPFTDIKVEAAKRAKDDFFVISSLEEKTCVCYVRVKRLSKGESRIVPFELTHMNALEKKGQETGAEKLLAVVLMDNSQNDGKYYVVHLELDDLREYADSSYTFLSRGRKRTETGTVHVNIGTEMSPKWTEMLEFRESHPTMGYYIYEAEQINV